MFADAYESATGFTRPIVTCFRTTEGAIGSGIATLLILNSDGWVVTADHVMIEVAKYQEQVAVAAGIRAEEAKVAEEPDPNRRRAAAKRIQRPKEPIVEHFTVWFGQDGLHIDGPIIRYPYADLALFKLSGLDPMAIEYPTFKRPTSLRPGTSLIKVGYPFHTVQPEWLPDRPGVERLTG